MLPRLREHAPARIVNVELARRLDGSGITANAGTPNRLTGTGFAHNVHFLAKVALTAWRPFALSTEKGAVTNDDARRLWDLTVSLTGVDLA